MDYKQQILEKINNNSVVVGVIGLGYVGLPLAVAFAKNGITVLGFEKSQSKAAMINEGKNYVSDVNSQELSLAVRSKKLSATCEFSRIKECDAVILCVPTPLDKFKKLI
jgi:UDP-N-acetyl-D-glucosamine dehydrogenase